MPTGSARRLNASDTQGCHVAGSHSAAKSSRLILTCSRNLFCFTPCNIYNTKRCPAAKLTFMPQHIELMHHAKTRKHNAAISQTMFGDIAAACCSCGHCSSNIRKQSTIAHHSTPSYVLVEDRRAIHTYWPIATAQHWQAQDHPNSGGAAASMLRSSASACLCCHHMQCQPEALTRSASKEDTTPPDSSAILVM